MSGEILSVPIGGTTRSHYQHTSNICEIWWHIAEASQSWRRLRSTGWKLSRQKHWWKEINEKEHTGKALGVVAITRSPVIHHNSACVRSRRTSIHVNVRETLNLFTKEMSSRSFAWKQSETIMTLNSEHANHSGISTPTGGLITPSGG